MIEWTKSSDLSIKSSDGKLSIAKFTVQGQEQYMVFKHIDRYNTTPLMGFDTPQQAKDYAESLT